MNRGIATCLWQNLLAGIWVFTTKFFQLGGMFKFFHNKMLGGKGGRAQNVKSCSKMEDHSREDLSIMSWWKDWGKKKGSQWNSIGHSQLTGPSNWCGRLGKIEKHVGWKPGCSASLARETISPMKALMEMPGPSSHLETVSWHCACKQTLLLLKWQRMQWSNRAYL